MPAAPAIFALLAAAMIIVWRPDILGLDGEVDEEGETIQGITHVVLSDQSSALPSIALRGCCGQPTQFRWVYADKDGSVSSPFPTRLLALDALGRPASRAACAALKVNVSIGGHGRLTHATATMVWKGPELALDIESRVAEALDVQVRIESPNIDADTLLYSSSFRFAPGTLHRYDLRLQPVGQERASAFASTESAVSPPRSTWPAQTVLDVVLSARDDFGNVVAMPEGDVGRMRLKANHPDLQVQSPFKAEGRHGALARVLCPTAAVVDLSVEQDGRALLAQALRMEFVGSTATKPGDWRSAGKNLTREDAKWQDKAGQVREAFLHAWRGYSEHAWGYDELMPLSKQGKDTFGHIGMTIIDSMSTMWMMGLPDEFDKALEFVKNDLNFDSADADVSVFELVIRALGGLLGAYSFSGHPVLLDKARELGDRLLPAFNSSSGLPYPRWNLATGRGERSTVPTVLAEAGSVQLELRQLTSATGDLKYRKAADTCFDAVQSIGITGLIPVSLSAPDVVPTVGLNDRLAMGANADSYYEYLLKQWLQSPSEVNFKDLWLKVMEELPALIPHHQKKNPPGGKHRLIESTPSGLLQWKQDHLSCFTPGMIALGLRELPAEDLARDSFEKKWRRSAEALTRGCAEMWTSTKSGLAPEYVPVEEHEPFNFKKAPDGGRRSFLRPETAESLFYLYRLTRDETYRDLGLKMFEALNKHAKVPAGFATVNDVYRVPVEHSDEMHTFVMAETFKYLYLLFSPDDALDLDRFVLNTEGHPLPRLSFVGVSPHAAPAWRRQLKDEDDEWFDL